MIKENVPLKTHTTYKIGGNARFFCQIKKTDEIPAALELARKNRLPVFILGGGSNILFSDKGFKGVVIKCAIREAQCQEAEIKAGAGIPLYDLVLLAKDNSLAGLEWAAGIPGTLGGAIYGNAQAFGVRMSDLVLWVEAIDLKSRELRRLTNKQCGFKTKNSVFKKNKNLLIVSAGLSLIKGDKKEIDKKVKELINYRKTNHPLSLPSAGSVFVNPEIKITNKKLLAQYPELSEFAKKGYIHSGFLIEKCGLKGKRIGGAKISEKHGNFIVNCGNAKAKDVAALINLAKRKVKNRFGINLETEIQIVK